MAKSKPSMAQRVKADKAFDQRMGVKPGSKADKAIDRADKTYAAQYGGKKGKGK